MVRFAVALFAGCVVALAAASAAAQALGNYDDSVSARRERFGEDHWILTGAVELKQGDTTIFADEVELFLSENRAIARGNVVLNQGTNRIAADRADFDTRTQFGTFYNASGIAVLQPQRERPRPGGPVAPPPVTGEETDVYFYGESVDKIGPRTYKIKNGGFTTCVQPTPRWELSSDTIILNIDRYTTLHDAILKVKGVPMLYLPLLVYPTKKEQRATGFLIPTYGSSTLRGSSLHNAFFWAIDRSQDATFLYDWYSATGNGTGVQYRFNEGPASNGYINTYLLDSHNATYTNSDGSTSTLAGERSYQIQGGVNELLPYNLRARANVNYFSNLTEMQTFTTNIYDASATTRTFGGNLVGSWGAYTASATLDHTESFYGTTSSALTGSAPSFSFSRTERPLFGSPVFFSVAAQFANLLHDSQATGTDGTVTEINTGLNRLDFKPQIRYPFKGLEWLTITSTVSFDDTWYGSSLNPTNLSGSTVGQPLNRHYYSIQEQLLGPIFTRVWDTPHNKYAEKFKHSIEPYLNLQRISALPLDLSSGSPTDRIVTTDAIDAVVGGTTSYNYGVTNRFFAKRREGQRSQAREVLDVQLDQTYYTNAAASQFDLNYSTSFQGAAPSPFSPYALSIRALPTNDLNVTMRAEFDSTYNKLRTISLNSSYTWGGRLQSTIGWSKKSYIAQLVGFNDPTQLDHYLNATTNLHTKNNTLGTIYSFNYDILHASMLQQNITGFYNAQCCGIAFQYQSFNFSGISGFVIPSDQRFFISFTLAGLGNFSPMNGALSGAPH